MSKLGGNTPARFRQMKRRRRKPDFWVVLAMVLSILCVILVVAVIDHERTLDRLNAVVALFVEEQNQQIQVLNRYEIRQVVNAASAQYDLPAELILAIIEVESNFDQNAVSPVGAMGLMQLMPLTAKELKVGDPFNPVHNIYGGVKYIDGLLKRFKGNKKLALAAYNAGPGAVRKYGGIPPYRETKHYVKKVMKAYQRNVQDSKSRSYPKLQKT